MDIRYILECGSYIATISGIIFLIIQVNSAKKSYDLSKEDYIKRNSKDDKEKAVDLAKYYVDNITSNILYLKRVYSESPIYSYIERLDIRRFKDFDVYEVENFFSVSEIEKIKKSLEKFDLKTLIKASNLKCDNGLKEHLNGITTIRIHDNLKVKNPKKQLHSNNKIVNIDKKKDITQSNIDKNDEEKKNSRINKMNEILNSYAYYNNKYTIEFSNVVYGTLNNLEYFCMYFNIGIADDLVVYQSIHQSFFDIIKILYFDIALENNEGKDKYYTNIIKLYSKWIKIYNSNLEKEVESKRGNVINCVPIKHKYK